ncbi:Helix-turn-helix domain protein [Coleofasciculus chthonoplastes PCC 7420]|uniref:Helix-turn-helix domain protein n=1 Tax=Coleofasciculus chthonoplastes PCC 7420 TaxID=118168 RepID=B4VGW7_9CYAN|nr:helix-turn-helix domain-containing protein [Coleofasciculus chthonoplastes]EDX78652.1 Helix-turn-helix domain protein [Coleofasciculus chthonoplastes PCC 7420]
MSVRVAPQYIREVKQAYKRRCHTQQRLAEELGMNRDTISKFVNGKFISYSYFEEICQKLGLNLEKIADFEIEENEPSDSSERLSSLEERLLGYGGLSDLQSSSDPVEPPPQHRFPVLFDRILEIDFKEQSQRFKQVIELQRTAGFLVHGEPCYGQQFLLNRLLRLIPGRQNQSPIKIDVSSNGVGKSIPNLWRELTACLQLPREATPTEIMDRVCDRWQTQDVIFVFYTVDYMPPGMLSEWLQEFWEPLVTRAKKSLPQGDRHLLMFLVDNCGSVGQSNVRLAENFEQPEYPLRLPPASLFPREALDEWIDNLSMSSQLQIPTGLTANVLLERSDNGVPHYVYEEICRHCGLSWEGVLAKWLI